MARLTFFGGPWRPLVVALGVSSTTSRGASAESWLELDWGAPTYEAPALHQRVAKTIDDDWTLVDPWGDTPLATTDVTEPSARSRETGRLPSDESSSGRSSSGRSSSGRSSRGDTSSSAEARLAYWLPIGQELSAPWDDVPDSENEPGSSSVASNSSDAGTRQARRSEGIDESELPSSGLCQDEPRSKSPSAPGPDHHFEQTTAETATAESCTTESCTTETATAESSMTEPSTTAPPTTETSTAESSAPSAETPPLLAPSSRRDAQAAARLEPVPEETDVDGLVWPW